MDGSKTCIKIAVDGCLGFTIDGLRQCPVSPSIAITDASLAATNNTDFPEPGNTDFSNRKEVMLEENPEK